MIEQIREWLLTCPLLSGQRLNINHLSGDALEKGNAAVSQAAALALVADLAISSSQYSPGW